jgi:hypothetical protein
MACIGCDFSLPKAALGLRLLKVRHPYIGILRKFRSRQMRKPLLKVILIN